ncbi:hypothetical protein ABIA99_003736 [Bradyrhizobium sp. LB12.1]|uniref:hypothetical protein n=1 Tax=Bradyrhizobium sp. LB12.1 TaxID=3156327 RepID=UPI003397128C
MRFLLALLALGFAILPTYQSDASEDNLELRQASDKAAAAIQSCNQFGASFCLPELTLSIEQLTKSFDADKLRLSKLACNSPLWATTTDRYLVTMKGFGTGIVRIMEGTEVLGRTDRSERANVGELSYIINQLMRFGANMLLATGDLALKSGCRNEADRSYRAVIASFVGEDMAAYRERARIGIEDVRNSAGLLCRTIGYC